MSWAPEITTLKCINLLNVLYELQRREWQSLGLGQPMRGQSKRLPDGREDIFQRLWDEVSQDQWGNQQFTNDCFYRVTCETYADDSLALEDLSEDMRLLFDYCKEAVNPDEGGVAFLLFEVSW